MHSNEAALIITIRHSCIHGLHSRRNVSPPSASIRASVCLSSASNSFLASISRCSLPAPSARHPCIFLRRSSIVFLSGFRSDKDKGNIKSTNARTAAPVAASSLASLTASPTHCEVTTRTPNDSQKLESSLSISSLSFNTKTTFRAVLLAFISALATGHTKFRTYRFGQLVVSLIKEQIALF